MNLNPITYLERKFDNVMNVIDGSIRTVSSLTSFDKELIDTEFENLKKCSKKLAKSEFMGELFDVVDVDVESELPEVESSDVDSNK